MFGYAFDGTGDGIVVQLTPLPTAFAGVAPTTLAPASTTVPAIATIAARLRNRIPNISPPAECLPLKLLENPASSPTDTFPVKVHIRNVSRES